MLARVVMAMAFAAILILSASRGLHQFFLTSLIGPTTFISLACGLGSVTETESPFKATIALGPWAMFAISAAITLLSWYWFEKRKPKNPFAAILLAVFAVNWIFLAFNTKYYDDWKLENYLTVPFALILFFTHRAFRLSNVSYGLIYLYMMLHIYGSHYTYSEVPFGFYLQELLGMARNHYDRIVHFAFGFLLAYPTRELTVRITNARGFWGLYMPVEFVLAFSAIYEIIEWLVAVIYGGDLGIAYLGTQGDVWDAIKDMALAGSGAAIAMLVIAIILTVYNRKEFFAEVRASFKVKEPHPLGEEALGRFLKKE